MTPPPIPAQPTSAQAAAIQMRLRAPADVIAAVPYLLGFHPTDSIVVVGLRGPALVFHARSDLPNRGAGQDEVTNLAKYLTEVLSAQGVSAVLAIGFGQPDRVTPLMLVLAEVLPAAGLVLADQLRVTDGRYWSYLCQEPTCCPPEGSPCDPAASVIAAQATLAGCVALPDRDCLVRTLDPPTGERLAAIQAVTRRVVEQVRKAVDGAAPHFWSTALHTTVDGYEAGELLTDEQIAWLTVLLARNRSLSAQALLMIDEERSRPVQERVHPAMWSDVVRRCDPTQVVIPAVLLAYSCWLAGDGVRAGVAVDRALAIEPDCPAAQLISNLLRRAVPPTPAPELAIDIPPRKTRRRSRSRRAKESQ